MGVPLAALGTAFQITDLFGEAQQSRDNAYENKKTALSAAADAIARGDQEAAKVRGEGRQLGARQKVAFAASGVDATVGTAAEVQAGTAMMSELDAARVRNNAAREAWGLKKQGRQIEEQEVLNQRRYQSQMVGTALGGAGKIAGGVGEK